jgi:hypothetical protein
MLRYTKTSVGVRGTESAQVCTADREIPVGPTLAAVLDIRPRHAPDGKELPLSAFILGNECGEQIKAVRTAWRATCARADIALLHFSRLAAGVWKPVARIRFDDG